MKEWFRARNSWGAAIRTLADEEAGRLMKALWEYTMTGNQVELQGIEKGIFALILFNLEQDEKRDDELAKKRAVNGAAGGKRKAANLAKAKQAQEETNDEANAGYAAGKIANAANDKFATDGVANVANAKFATDSVANVANATNKKQKQIQKQNQNQSQSQNIARMFERFWAAYPRKEAKQAAWESFDEIEPDEKLLETMITAIEAWKKSDQWTREGGRFIPHPGTWLNQKRWEDELPKGGGPKAIVTAQQYGQRDYSGVNAEIEAQMDREMELYTKLGGFPLNQRLPCDTVATGDRSAIAPQTPFGDM